jgi:hypothetical protein
MKVFVIASLTTLSSFIVHWLLWRIQIPKRQSAWLLTVFMSVMLAAWALCSRPFIEARGWGLEWPLQFIHMGVFHVAMTLGYIVAYSAIEEQSPSMALLTWIADAGAFGRNREEVVQRLCQSSPIDNRLQAMLRDRMITMSGDSYTLTGKGRRWAFVFTLWSRVAHIPRGG